MGTLGDTSLANVKIQQKLCDISISMRILQEISYELYKYYMSMYTNVQH